MPQISRCILWIVFLLVLPGVPEAEARPDAKKKMSPKGKIEHCVRLISWVADEICFCEDPWCARYWERHGEKLAAEVCVKRLNKKQEKLLLARKDFVSANARGRTCYGAFPSSRGRISATSKIAKRAKNLIREAAAVCSGEKFDGETDMEYFEASHYEKLLFDPELNGIESVRMECEGRDLERKLEKLKKKKKH